MGGATPGLNTLLTGELWICDVRVLWGIGYCRPSDWYVRRRRVTCGSWHAPARLRALTQRGTSRGGRSTQAVASRLVAAAPCPWPVPWPVP